MKALFFHYKELQNSASAQFMSGRTKISGTARTPFYFSLVYVEFKHLVSTIIIFPFYYSVFQFLKSNR